MQQRKTLPIIATLSPPRLPVETPTIIVPIASVQMPLSWPQHVLPPSCSTPPQVTIYLPPPSPLLLLRRRSLPRRQSDPPRLLPRSHSTTRSIVHHRSDNTPQMNSPEHLQSRDACRRSLRGRQSAKISQASIPQRSNGLRARRWIPVVVRELQGASPAARNNGQSPHCPLVSGLHQCASLVVVVVPAVLLGHALRETQQRRPPLPPEDRRSQRCPLC